MAFNVPRFDSQEVRESELVVLYYDYEGFLELLKMLSKVEKDMRNAQSIEDIDITRIAVSFDILVSKTKMSFVEDIGNVRLVTGFRCSSLGIMHETNYMGVQNITNTKCKDFESF